MLFCFIFVTNFVIWSFLQQCWTFDSLESILGFCLIKYLLLMVGFCGNLMLAFDYGMFFCYLITYYELNLLVILEIMILL